MAKKLRISLAVAAAVLAVAGCGQQQSAQDAFLRAVRATNPDTEAVQDQALITSGRMICDNYNTKQGVSTVADLLTRVYSVEGNAAGDRLKAIAAGATTYLCPKPQASPTLP